jgi:AcrR family transcriptional regulator
LTPSFARAYISTVTATGSGAAPAQGLRERKKRQTRAKIAEVAVGLFVARGFDQVTMAEVADAAEVSVNTVYNYFHTKDELVLSPETATPDRLADIVARRPVGRSAAESVLEHLRAELRARDRAIGLTEGFGRVLAMILAAPTLAARLDEVGAQMRTALATRLAQESGAAAEDPLPRLVAGQIAWCHEVVFAEVGRRTLAGEPPDEVADAVLELLDTVEGLLGDRVLSYAIRKG